MAITTHPIIDLTEATPAERVDEGRRARSAVARSAHRDWVEPAHRPDPVMLIAEQDADRVPWLVPLRHGRMSVSAFTFYRGAARIMATDLASMPDTGLTVQLGGDAHLSNFGGYASPERQLLFDANDFDETLPGPFEWDVKRLAASFTVAAEDRGFAGRNRRAITTQAVAAYRLNMSRYAEMGFLECWYEHLAADDVAGAEGPTTKQIAARLERFERKARSKTSLDALRKLSVEEDGRFRIKSDPPVLFPLRDLATDHDVDAYEYAVHAALDGYKATLPDDRRHLLDRYHVVDIGVKVVGVGSVGTRCFIVLLEGRDRNDPLFLQVKEAGPSVLAEHLGASDYDNEGRRVVEGQRLTQAQSDIFLGWTQGGIEGRHYYVRQLRDWKGSAEIEGATPSMLSFYAQLCGMTLARGHARSGDPAAIAAYLGGSDTFDRAVADFGEAYAAQNRHDFTRFCEAIDDGRLAAVDPITYDAKTAVRGS